MQGSLPSPKTANFLRREEQKGGINEDDKEERDRIDQRARDLFDTVFQSSKKLHVFERRGKKERIGVNWNSRQEMWNKLKEDVCVPNLGHAIQGEREQRKKGLRERSRDDTAP